MNQTIIWPSYLIVVLDGFPFPLCHLPTCFFSVPRILFFKEARQVTVIYDLEDIYDLLDENPAYIRYSLFGNTNKFNDTPYKPCRWPQRALRCSWPGSVGARFIPIVYSASERSNKTTHIVLVQVSQAFFKLFFQNSRSTKLNVFQNSSTFFFCKTQATWHKTQFFRKSWFDM